MSGISYQLYYELPFADVLESLVYTKIAPFIILRPACAWPRCSQSTCLYRLHIDGVLLKAQPQLANALPGGEKLQGH